MKSFTIVLIIIAASLFLGCGSGGGDDSNVTSTPTLTTERVLNVEDLGGDSWMITLNYAGFGENEGTPFLVGQKAPDDAWIDYSVVRGAGNTGTVTINNWPGGYFEFSFGVEVNGNRMFVAPVGKYVFPTDPSTPENEKHFRVKLGGI